ncbi:MAG: hypothetical protein WBA74_27370 [Cyclobacteriaceae bacterium]
MLKRIHYYVLSGNSGTRQQLATRLEISVSQLAKYLNHMREIGINLNYDRYNSRYYYADQKVHYECGFVINPIENSQTASQ